MYSNKGNQGLPPNMANVPLLGQTPQRQQYDEISPGCIFRVILFPGSENEVVVYTENIEMTPFGLVVINDGYDEQERHRLMQFIQVPFVSEAVQAPDWWAKRKTVCKDRTLPAKKG